MSTQRVTAAELSSFLRHAASPMYLVDENRKIVFCNQACAETLGIAAAELIGLECQYHTPAEPVSARSLAAALCPPPPALCGQTTSALVRFENAAGNTVARHGYFFPLSDGQDQSSEVLAVLDVSDQRHAEEAAADALHEQVRRYRIRMARRYQSDQLIGDSPAIKRARAQIELAASSPATVLVVGPNGSGREHAAKAIHYARSAASLLVPLDCSLLETNLLRSTLRALWSQHAAMRDAASTLLLLLVAAAPPEVQSDLLELLNGSSSVVRVLSTADRSLVELASAGQFSPELACVLSTITIDLPALAGRLDDLPLLAQAFVEQANLGGAKQVGGVSREALDRLLLYSWPENVDELALVITQAHAAAQGAEIVVSDLPKQIQWAAESAVHPSGSNEVVVLEEFLSRVELELITRALRRAKGNKSKAAKLLGMTRPRLYRRLVQLGLEKPPTPRNEAQP